MTEGQPSLRATITRNLVIMVVSVAVLDAVAIAAFYALHLNQDESSRRTIFIAIWTFVSLIVVVVPLRRIRSARAAALGGRPRPGTSSVGPGGERPGGG